jgi:hypothetical protein
MGGSLSAWSRQRVHWRRVAFGAILGQVALFNPLVEVQPWAVTWGPWLWVASMFGVLAVLLRNGWEASTARYAWLLAALGVALNLAVVIANGGYMPRLEETAAAAEAAPQATATPAGVVTVSEPTPDAQVPSEAETSQEAHAAPHAESTLENAAATEATMSLEASAQSAEVPFESEPTPDAQASPEAEPPLETEPAPEADATPETAATPVSEPAPDAQEATQAETSFEVAGAPEAEVVAESQALPEAEAAPEASPEAEPAPDTDAVTEAAPAPEAEAALQTNSAAEAKAALQTDVLMESQAPLRTRPAPESETIPVVAAASEAYLLTLTEAAPVAETTPAEPQLLTNVRPMTPETRLAWLGDIIPQPEWLPLANVVSIGDLLLSAGIAWWAFLATGGRIPRWRPALARASEPQTEAVRAADTAGRPDNGSQTSRRRKGARRRRRSEVPRTARHGSVA